MRYLQDICNIWLDEMKAVFKDEGILIFFILLPLGYPLLYSWVYNNELVREVPVVVVDRSNTEMSRTFIRECDASPDVKIAYHATDMDEAKRYMASQQARGIYLIPEDFQTRLNRMEQSPIAVYTDMSLMLTYKAIYQTAQAVSTAMNSKIQIQMSGNYTSREDEIGTKPLDFEEVALFNPQGGYGSFVLPAVLVLILQQTLLLGIGMSMGSAHERKGFRSLYPPSDHPIGVFRLISGKTLCYLMIYAVMATYLLCAVPRFFHFIQLANPMDLACMALPYILACIFFSMTLSVFTHYRENVMLLVVFTSLPFLFLSGLSWPQSSIPTIWQVVSWIVPSTFAIRAYVRMNSMGACLNDCSVEYLALWAQVVVYFVTACLTYAYELKREKRYSNPDKEASKSVITDDQPEA